jgi:hypothetical protein
MNMQRRIFASTGIVLIFATASLAQQVKTDYDREANFNQYKTYSWEKVQTQDSLWVDRIKEAVNTDLAAKGWTPVQSGGDVSIVAVETTQNQQTLDTFYDGFGAVGAGEASADLEIQRQPLKPIRSVRSLSTCSTQRPKSLSGGDRPVTPSQTNPTRT